MIRLAAACAVGASFVVSGSSALRAQAPAGITPWQVGDVFVGVGSGPESGGVYRTLDPTGARKADVAGLNPLLPVPDLIDGLHELAVGCTVDRAVPNGDMWTAAWTGLVLQRFSAQTHQVADAFHFKDPDTLLNTPLARLPRAAGVAPLPVEAIGAADDPRTPLVDETVVPDIQAFEQIVFANDGQFYVGTQTLASTGNGVRHAYLLRFRFDDLALPEQRLTLTGWWRVDAGATGVDELDLSSDQHTIFYTSEDDYIRAFDTTTGQPKPSIVMTQMASRDANGNPVWEPLGTRAYGVRILPTGDADPLKAGDGSEGFLVATARGAIFRLDKDGHVVDGYDIPGRPFSVNLTPDAQSVWTATPDGGSVYRFHIASHKRYGPFTVGANSAYGLCVKREYVAAAGVCLALNVDGTPQMSGGSPVQIPCETPARCWPDPRVTGLGADGLSNTACYPPGERPIAVVDQDNFEGDSVSINLTSMNAGIVFTGATGLPDGIAISTSLIGGVTNYFLGGTIAWSACNEELPNPCTLPVRIFGSAPSGNASSTNFVWTIHKKDAIPTLTVPPATTLVLQKGPVSLPLAAWDDDAQEPLIVHVSGQPPGMTMESRIGYGTGYRLSLSGIPQADPAVASYPHEYTVTVDLFDCDPNWADMNVSGATIPSTAVLAAATDPAGPCFHRVTRTFAVTVITEIQTPPTLNVANQSSMANVPLPVPYYFCGAGPCASSTPAGHALLYTVTGGALPAGLALNPSTGQVTGMPTVPVLAQPVTITVTDTTNGLATTKSFTWSVSGNRAPTCSAATVTPRLIWSSSHRFVPFQIQNVADADGDRVALKITSITQDQPVDDTGEDDEFIDGIGVGYSLGAVRAERAGDLRVLDDGRLYQINFSASDGKPGGSCTGTVFIGVPEDQNQHMPADNGCRWDSLSGHQLTPCAWLHAPALQISDRTSYEGDAISVRVQAVDVDGTPLTYAASSLPPGLSMSSVGLITGTIPAGAAGGRSYKTFTVTATVNDGYGTSKETFTWTVKPRQR